ncbi:hypothetical protein CERZMDRAFT_103211 [Cercospora zeae-maydis SCOH1-5]|uniref:Uncharacterized protein n=1 Tax=Cercospora zeae-maydis SCOH1-5 TaxID=717836 RepID=A0A6A6EZL9_9PEZI|nr:hypothetical protein CERZMDRAFT_103211 [Cercospora zeae-maydis SCOH1-5]
MAKKRKQQVSDVDDDVYLEVKRETCDSPMKPKCTNQQEKYATPTTKTSRPSEAQGAEGTPCTAKFSKETRSALKIVRKHSPSTPLYKTAIVMISEYVLANKIEQPDMSIEGKAFDCIEKELWRKSTPRYRMTLVMEHVRAEVGCTLARSLAHYIEDQDDLDRALLAVRAAAENKIPGIAGKRHASNKDEGATVFMRVDQNSIIGGNSRAITQQAPNAKGSEAKKCFDPEPVLAIRQRAERTKNAKRHFPNSRELFEFHARHLQSPTGDKTCSKQDSDWSSLVRRTESRVTTAFRGTSQRLETSLNEGRSAAIGAAAGQCCHDDSESDPDTIGDKRVDGPGGRLHSASQSEYEPTAEESAKMDGLPRNVPWTEEEKRILLKGMYHGWSNEKISSELPHTTRKRTSAAVACQRSNMKKRHPNGVPVIRADTPFPLAASSSTKKPQPATSPPSVRRSAVADERPLSSASSIPYLIPTPHSPHLLQWPVHTSFDRPRPTLIRYRRRPPLTAETQRLEYLLLPIETPECPALNFTPEDVSKACEQAFDKSAAFRAAQKLEDALWVASFERSGTPLVPMRRLSKTTIHFRSYRFRAHYLSFKPRQIFVADIPQEAVAGRSSIVAAIHRAFESWPSLPQLALQAIARPRHEQSRRILARFHGNPGLVQFYIPVQLGSSPRWLHIRFGPLDLALPCWHCGGLHRDGWCDKAELLPCSSA